MAGEEDEGGGGQVDGWAGRDDGGLPPGWLRAEALPSVFFEHPGHPDVPAEGREGTQGEICSAEAGVQHARASAHDELLDPHAEEACGDEVPRFVQDDVEHEGRGYDEYRGNRCHEN